MKNTVISLIGKLYVLALILMPLEHMRFPPSLIKIISVTLVVMDQDLVLQCSTLMTHCESQVRQPAENHPHPLLERC